MDLSFCGQHFSDFNKNILRWPREKAGATEWERSEPPLTSLIIRSPRPRAMSPPSEGRAKEWRMRVCQVQTTKRCYLTHPFSTCPLQWQWHHLNHLNPPQHDLWQVTRHSSTHTSTWEDCGTAYLAENTARLTTWFIQNYSSMVLLHTEHLPISSVWSRQLGAGHTSSGDRAPGCIRQTRGRAGGEGGGGEASGAQLPRQAGITKQSGEGEWGMQARHFRIHLAPPSYLPGHFISSLGRVMHVPKLCKMHNQAFKYTPCEWAMCTHVYDPVKAYCTLKSAWQRCTT